MKQQITAGIDIGTQTTRVVICNTKVTNGLPTIIGAGTSASRGIRHGYIANRDEAIKSIREAVLQAETQAGTKIRALHVAVGGIGINCEYASGTSVVTRADGIITKFDVDKAITDAEAQIDLKNKTILHAFPINFKIDGKELLGRPEGIQGLKLEVRTLFVTSFSQHIEDFIELVNEAGIKVTGIYATPIAAAQLLLTELQRNLGCILIDIGAETVSVSVHENNVLSSVHVFGIGSLDITKDIALGLRISPEDAENIKLGVVSFQSVPKKKLDEIIEARLSDIFELVDKYLKKIGRSGLLPAGAIIIGNGAQIPMTESVAKTMLKIPVRMGSIELPSTQGMINDQRFIVAYCVAIKDTEMNSPNKNSSNSDNGESIGSFLKNFFKQLMP